MSFLTFMIKNYIFNYDKYSFICKNMQILAIIPARGGSKGIKNKNIRNFCGKPLISYAINQACQAKKVNRVIVSTDDHKIAAVAKKYGAEVPFLRPKELALDNSKVVDAVLHLLEELKNKENYQPDAIILLQTTSPMRTINDINKALLLFTKSKADSLVSICQTENLLLAKNSINELEILNTVFLESSNRQELQNVYKLDGSMIYIVKTDKFLQSKSFFTGKLVGYEIPRWRAVDLDEPQDYVIGEIFYKNFKKIQDKIKKFK